MSENPSYAAPLPEPGRSSAFLAYVFYLLSIPSAALFAPVGLIVAYAGRSGAGPNARAHLDNQIRIFWIAFLWGLGLAIACAVSWALTFLLIGFPLLLLVGLAAFILMAWFTVMSLIGLLRLLDRQWP
jgi:uncharacterized membrane protein